MKRFHVAFAAGLLLAGVSLGRAADEPKAGGAKPADAAKPAAAPADNADKPGKGNKGDKALKGDPNAGFAPLFNGKDLAGWVDVGTGEGKWKAENGLMVVDKAEHGGWIRTEKEYKDFVLQLDYKLPPGGNSGVFLHAPAEGNGAYVGMEIQILDHFDPMYHKPGEEIKPAQYTGSVYDVVPSSDPKAIKPAGEWNHYRIRLKDNKIKVILNGKVLVDADLSKFPEKLKDHPGLGREKGFIGLQSHGSRAEFRNIMIKELK